jgi:hypothetical protein
VTACDSPELLAEALEQNQPQSFDAALLLAREQPGPFAPEAEREALITRIHASAPRLSVALWPNRPAVFTTLAKVVVPFDADMARVVDCLRVLCRPTWQRPKGLPMHEAKQLRAKARWQAQKETAA